MLWRSWFWPYEKRKRSRPRCFTTSGCRALHFGVDCGLLAGLLDLVVDLAARALDGLLDARGLDTTVLDQPGEGDTGDLPAYRIEARDCHQLRRVVDDEVAAGGCLEGTDVAAFSADDAPLEVVRRDGQDTHRRLSRDLRGESLHDRRQRLTCARVRLGLRRRFHSAHSPSGLVAQLHVEAGQQLLARLLGGQAGDTLEVCSRLLLRLVRLVLAALDLLCTVAQRLLTTVEGLGAAFDRLLALFEAALHATELAAFVAQFLLSRFASFEGASFSLELLRLDTMSRLIEDPLGFRLGAGERTRCGTFLIDISTGDADDERADPDDRDD